MTRATVLSLVIALLACDAAGSREPLGEIDAERAFADLRAQVEIGPRPAGSEGAARTRALISERLRQAGWTVEEHVFEAGSPPVRMINLIGTQQGSGPETVLLSAHYDTKNIPGIRFLGANDGASGVALLLELARVLGPHPGRLTRKLLFFDGEEAFGESITVTDGLYGSTALAQRMYLDGSLRSVRALVNFDMIGDRDLNLAVDLRSSERLRRIVSEVDPTLVDASQQLALVDDHVAFIERGVPDVLGLIDFQFGARFAPGPRWHTEADDLSSVSADSLNRMGRLAIELLRRIEE